MKPPAAAPAELDPGKLKRVLPALRRMVRFPTRPLATISTELAIELSEIQAHVAAHGRPTQAALEAFEDRLAGAEPPRSETLGRVESRKTFPPKPAVAVAVAPPPAPPPPAPPKPAPPKPAPQPEIPRGISARPAPAPAAPPPAPPAPPPSPAKSGGGRGRTATQGAYREVARRLLAEPRLLESQACRQVGLHQGTWSAFKGRQFGPGPVDRAKLAAYLGQPGAPAPRAEKPAPEKDAPGGVGPDTVQRAAAREERRERALEALVRAVGALSEAVQCLAKGGAGA